MKLGMKEIEAEIEGICAMKMDRHLFPDEVEKEPKTQEEYKEQAKMKVYRNKKGQLVIKAEALEASLRHSAYYIAPNNKKTRYKDDVYSAVHIEPRELVLTRDNGKKDAPIKKYDEMAQDYVKREHGKQTTSVVTYRPLIKEGWKVKFKINYLTLGDLTPKFLEDALTVAGLRFGLLGHRPKFGRFKVNDFGVKE